MDFKLKKSNLNFRVYTAATIPTTGTENDIVIISEVPMTNWIMSPDKPSGVPRSDGDVWIQYSVSGSTFNALKNSTMMIATISAWQYVDGAWGDVTAMSYQNGEWVDWFRGVYFIKEGADHSSKWGASTAGTGGSMSFSNGIMNLKMNATNSGAGAVVFPYVTELQDLTNYTTLKAKFKCETIRGLITLGVYPAIPPSNANYKRIETLRFTQTEAELTVNISDISDGYLAICFDADLNSPAQTAQLTAFVIE